MLGTVENNEAGEVNRQCQGLSADLGERGGHPVCTEDADPGGVNSSNKAGGSSWCVMGCSSRSGTGLRSE